MLAGATDQRNAGVDLTSRNLAADGGAVEAGFKGGVRCRQYLGVKNDQADTAAEKGKQPDCGGETASYQRL